MIKSIFISMEGEKSGYEIDQEVLGKKMVKNKVEEVPLGFRCVKIKELLFGGVKVFFSDGESIVFKKCSYKYVKSSIKQENI